MTQTATQNKLAEVIMNGQSRIDTAWGKKSVVGIADMLDRYADERLVMGVFRQRKPLEIFCTMLNSFGDIDTTPKALLEYFIEYLELILENKSPYEAISVVQERTANIDKKFGREPKTNNFWLVFTGAVDLFNFLFRVDDGKRGSPEHVAALQEILQKLKDKV